MNLNKKVWFITGANKGMGAAIKCVPHHERNANRRSD